MSKQKSESTHVLGDRLRPWIDSRFGGATIFVVVFMVFSAVSRIALTQKARDVLSWDLSLAQSYLIGTLFDLLTALLCAAPLAAYLAILPQKVFASRLHRRLVHVAVFIGLYVMAFISASEWVFWHELDVRFNFIAVDYLIYTYEVVGNIWQSYPMPAILLGLAVVATAAYLWLRRARWIDRWLASDTARGRRLLIGAVMVLVPLAAVGLVSQKDIPDTGNNNNRELAKNGVFSFFAALQANQLEYAEFYPTTDEVTALRRARTLTYAEDSAFRSAEDLLDFSHHVESTGDERHMNVIMMTIESLSTFFVGAYGGTHDLTPNIDRIAEHSLLFTRCFATGTRTTRGMEALTLSIPPTPGRSILHREGSGGLFNLGTVFRQRGYDTAFLYGGFGYFDHMNRFFGGNGHRLIDRSSAGPDEITFANVWGACDEDLYRWTINEADRDHEANTPFYFFVMTTSNHRPYTYPDGTIDIPSPGGRQGAVKYSDYAIGRFFAEASTRQWFDNTIFVIIADHTASSAGKAELEVTRYRIPWLIYSPGFIERERVHTLCSQVDVAPTLLGLLNFSYESTFFGADALTMKPNEGRVFVGNYQKLGLMRNNEVVVLKPVQQVSYYSSDRFGDNLQPIAEAAELEQDAIAAYQSAYLLFSRGRLAEEWVGY